MRALPALLLATACARLSITDAIESRPWPTTASLRALTERVSHADGYILGTIARAQADWTYDRPRGGPATFHLTVRATDLQHWHLWVFVPQGDTLPLTVGTTAVFIWRFAYVYPLLICAQRRAVTLVCPPDWLPVLQSLDDVASPADSTLVAELFARRAR